MSLSPELIAFFAAQLLAIGIAWGSITAQLRALSGNLKENKEDSDRAITQLRGEVWSIVNQKGQL